MKIKILLLIVSTFFFFENAHAQNVTIIESQSMGHMMDQYWYDVVTAAGGTPTIQPQTTLDNYASFGSADILIVASGVINIPANRANNIMLYLAFGHNVYLQSEYDINFSSNQVFDSIVNSLGGSFTWTATVPGVLQPTISTKIATTPNCVPSLVYHWYGATGTYSTNVESFMNYLGTDLGFIFCGPGGVGRMVTTSDQDWILHHDANDVHLMENIYYNLHDTTFICNVPLFSLGTDTAMCPGDTLILNAGGGFTAYQWQNGNTNSTLSVTAPGTYWVTVTSPCSTYTDTVIVAPSANCFLPPTPLLASSDTLFCGQQCIDFYDLSTNNPTSWQWLLPGADSSTSSLQNPTNICYNNYGSYDVTLIACNANGCDTLVLSNFIHVDSMPSINLGSDTLICDNDSVLLDAGAGFASYLWSDNSTTQSIYVSSAGNYAVQISNGGCFTTDTIAISTLSCAAAVALLSSSDTSFCEKLCIDFTDLSTNNPTSWQWFFPGADSLTSTLQNPTNICYNNYGSFDVTLIACNVFGCDTLVLSNFINEYPTPIPTIIQSNDTLFSSLGISYQWWSVDSGLIAGANNSYYIPTYGGGFFVIVTDTVGCDGTSNVITITGLKELAIGNWQLAIAPNPNDGSFSVSFNQPIKKDYSIRIIDPIGKILRAESKSINQNKIDVEVVDAAKGIYLIEIITGDVIYNAKFVIR
ncbi:MAG: T9SS type A sorting domain-containing protein [Bacteroidia bacterium]